MSAEQATRTGRWLREVGSIVLGVLIALALGAVAGEIGWALEVRSARASIAQELGEIVGQARTRERAERCYKAKLDRVAALVDAAAATGRLPPVADIGKPLFQSWSDGVWQSTQSAQTAAHFDQSELDDLAGLYELVRLLAQLNREEIGYWSDLSVLVGPGRAMVPEEAARLRAAVSGARTRSNLVAALSARVRQMVAAYDLPVDREDVRKYGDAPLASIRICRPPAPGAGRSGAGVMEGISDEVRANPIRRDPD